MPARHHPIGKAHRNERAGIEFLKKGLPSNYVLITNVELRAGHGRTYEHDAVIIAPWMIFTVELKAWSGRTRGNRDRWILEGGKVEQSPLPLQNQKAKVLKTLLGSRYNVLRGVWVQPLVFLTARDATVDLTAGYDDGVCTRKDIIRALTEVRDWPQATPLTRAQQDCALKVVLDTGTQPALENRLGPFRVLEQRPDRAATRYEVWLGEKHGHAQRILHVYPIKGGDEKTRERYRDYARREANLHERLLGGPGLIRYRDLEIITEPEEKYVLSFEDTTPFLPLPDWLERYRPGRQARLRVAQRVAEALSYVHLKEIVHRRITPDAVLVPDTASPNEVRLYALELARDLAHHLATISAGLLGAADERCTAPEVLTGGDATRRSDRFALGATLYELLTDTHAYADGGAVMQGELPPPLRLDDAPYSADVDEAVRLLLDADPLGRPELDRVIEAVREAQIVQPEPPRRTLGPGETLAHQLVIEAALGEGATGTLWTVRHLVDGQALVAKVAHDAEAGQALVNEADVLMAVEHPNLVRYHGRESHQGVPVLLLRPVDGVDGRTWAMVAEPLDRPCTIALGEGIFGALGALHDAGWLHRDVKPENVLLREPDGRPTVIDLGHAARIGQTGQLTSGTAAYKDPALFEVGRWQVRDDLFAAWITLFELLTHVRPFGAAPKKGELPEPDLDALNDALGVAVAERLGTLAQRALGPAVDARPQTAAAAAAAWREALTDAVKTPAPVPRPATIAPPSLPADLAVTDALDRLPLGVRAHRAVRTLGLTTVAQMLAVDPADLRQLRNVGRKTIDEIRAMAAQVAERFNLSTPPARIAPVRPPPTLAPTLRNDDRPLTALGTALTSNLRARLEQEGVASIGGLAALTEAQLMAMPRVGPSRVAKVRRALREMAGDAAPPSSLAELNQRLRDELGGRYRTLSAVLGLADGVARNQQDAAAALDVTRQAVGFALDRAPVRAAGSVLRHLKACVDGVIPDVGFATLPQVAERLATIWPASEGVSALGYARLAAVILDPAAAMGQAHQMSLACRAPWTEASVEALREALAHNANWPPIDAQRAAELMWEGATGRNLGPALISRRVTPVQLLGAVRAVCPDVTETPDGRLFTPPVAFAQALAERVDAPQVRGPLSDVLGHLRTWFTAVEDPIDLHAELAAHGLELVDDRVLAIDRPAPAPKQQVVVDTRVATRHLTPDGAMDVGELISGARLGGFRVVGLPPASHHRLCVHLCEALASRMGADAARLIDVDQVILDALRAAELWPDALVEERRPRPDFSWAAGTLRRALDAAITDVARRGTVTVLGRPTLLGPLGLMDWLGGLYERARGGWFGLLVLALPGGVHDGRVRLNERYQLTYTPDMAAVVYQEAAS